MKKYISILCVALALAGLTACNSNKDEIRVYDKTAAQAIAGTYEGEWHATSTEGLDTIYTKGCSVRFEVYKDTIGEVAMIYPRCDEAGWSKDLRGITNVSHAGDALFYCNEKTSNGIGAAFYGQVSEADELTMSVSFSEFDDETWQTILVSYSFRGKRVK